ncbi:helix-turn-helix domain-containing protein [Bradyrhizobium liaoningense]|uniref:helix-turn-helix domain-containing protein n=1 Tax=Bradyrhizobium liaoningense TaxID=43992 RepID=UPI001BA4C795|nr:helix-turn-helix domain-containing protein [Bradyrhizobium liaoningense]MBR0988028.1 helix-turn-helix domain-containing protein [Bradyrhizobium liaoningense]
MMLTAPICLDSAPIASSPLLDLASTDVDEHCENLGRWRLSYDQISGGPFMGSFTQLSLPRVEVFREVTSQQVRQYGQLGADSFGIGLPWQSGGEVNCNGASVTGAQVIACIDAEVDMCTPKGFELRGIVMSATLVAQLASALDIELPRGVWHQLRVIEMDEAPVARLRALLTMIYDNLSKTALAFDDLAASRALEDALLLEIMDMLPTARPCAAGRTTAARKRTVALACEMMLANDDRPVSILTVCKAVAVSPRKLGYCFQEVLGTSPMHYWRAMRLNRVRRDLRRCDDPQAGVYDIAARHGFWHFSQFSLDYKRHFCELPSETLRRARAAQRPVRAR